jgi:hypothetical protein
MFQKLAGQDYYKLTQLQWLEIPKGVSFDGNQFRTTEICTIYKLKEFFLAEKY